MDKKLNTIQKLAKAGNILSKIVFVCSIVGAILCGISIIIISITSNLSLSFGNLTIKGLIEAHSKLTVQDQIVAVTIGFVMCCAEILISRNAKMYFTNELTDGTPFTSRGAEELKRLGISTIIISVASTIISGIIYGIFSAITKITIDLNNDSIGQVGIGIAFIIMSVIFSYTAEAIKKD